MKRMTLKLMAILVWTCTLLSCETDLNEVVEDVSVSVNESQISSGEGMIALGDKIEYSESMEITKQALINLVDRGVEEAKYISLEPTHLYVRFLPANEVELEQLWGIEDPENYILFSDHPKDREIICEGSYYHDPSIDISKPTWQYTIVPVEFEFLDIEYEVLNEVFLIENSNADMSLELQELLKNETRAIVGIDENNTNGRKHKEGRKIKGSVTVDGIGVPAVRVVVNETKSIISHSKETGPNGVFAFEKNYEGDVDVRLRFRNKKGWKFYRAVEFGTKPYYLSDKIEEGTNEINFKLDELEGYEYVNGKEYKAIGYATIALDFYYKNAAIGNSDSRLIKSLEITKLDLGKVLIRIESDPNESFSVERIRNTGKIAVNFKSTSSGIQLIRGIFEVIIKEHYIKYFYPHSYKKNLISDSFAAGVSRKWLNKLAFVNPSYNCPEYTTGSTTTLAVVDLFDPVSGDAVDGDCGYSNDQVGGYSVSQIERALVGANSWNHWRDRIKEFHQNPTEQHVNELFEYWGEQAGL